MPAPLRRAIVVKTDSLYVEPVTGCNLRCGLCYSAYDTLKNSRIVPRERLMELVAQFLEAPGRGESPELYWCGTGEIFFYPRFTAVLNEISERWPQVQHCVQTNGTILPDPPLHRWDRVAFQVSIDGLRESHEANRGLRTYDRSIAFARHVYAMGSHVLIRCIVTRQNLGELQSLEAELHALVGPGCTLSITLPYDNQAIESGRSASLRKGFHNKSLNVLLSLSAREAIQQMRATYSEEFLARVFPAALVPETEAPEISIYPALAVDGVYTCCERIVKVGALTEDLAAILPRVQPSTCEGCGMMDYCRT